MGYDMRIGHASLVDSLSTVIEPRLCDYLFSVSFGSGAARGNPVRIEIGSVTHEKLGVCITVAGDHLERLRACNSVGEAETLFWTWLPSTLSRDKIQMLFRDQHAKGFAEGARSVRDAIKTALGILA